MIFPIVLVFFYLWLLNLAFKPHNQGEMFVCGVVIILCGLYFAHLESKGEI